jgi:hypothetical protein
MKWSRRLALFDHRDKLETAESLVNELQSNPDLNSENPRARQKAQKELDDANSKLAQLRNTGFHSCVIIYRFTKDELAGMNWEGQPPQQILDGSNRAKWTKVVQFYR